MKKPKPRRCHVCPTKFVPRNSTQVVCSPGCAIKHVAQKRERAERAKAKQQRAETRKKRQAMKTRRDLVAEAQAAFNAWVRERDHGLPCISCGRNDGEVMAQDVGGSWDCGHYRSRGACPELRFEPLNAHRQCKRCNRDRSGNVVEYRLRLVERIGPQAVEWLEGKHEPARWTREDLQRIKAHYRAEARRLKRQRETEHQQPRQEPHGAAAP